MKKKGSAMPRITSIFLLIAVFFVFPFSVAADEVDSPAEDAGNCEVEAFFAGIQCISEDGSPQWQIHHPSLWGRDDGNYLDDIHEIVLDERPDSKQPGDVDDEGDDAEGEEQPEDHRVWISDDADRVNTTFFPVEGPVTVDGRTFYSIHYLLLEVDTDKGAIIDRVRFPAYISELVPGDDKSLTVTVIFRGRQWDTKELDMRYYLDGPAPAQTYWTLAHPDPDWSIHGVSGMLNAYEDAKYLHAFIFNDIRAEEDSYVMPFYEQAYFKGETESVDILEDVAGPEDLDDSQIDTIIARLQSAKTTDQTNPFYAAYIGLWHRTRGDEEAANQAFSQALDTENTYWLDWAKLSFFMEDMGVSKEIVDAAFEFAIDDAEEIGLSFERRQTIIGLNTTLNLNDRGPEDSAINQALEREDAEEVHRLSLHRARLFPNMQEAHTPWFLLADWMDDQGHPELATDWRERAQSNKENSCSYPGKKEATFYRYVLLFTTVVLGALVLMLFIGLRAGAARRRHDEDHLDADSGGGSWMPRLRLWDILILVGLALVIVVVPPTADVHQEAITSMAELEPAIVEDSLASPTARQNIEEFVESPARADLLAIMDAEHQALVNGEEFPDKENICPLLIETVETHARHVQWEAFKDLSIVENTGHILIQLTPLEKPTPTTMILFCFILASIFVIGFVIGRKTTGLARVIRYMVPGAVLRPAPLADIALFLSIGALIFLRVYDSFPFTSDTEFIYYYLELGALTTGVESGESALVVAALGILGVIAVVHLVFVVFDIRAWRAEEDESDPPT